MTFRAVDPLEAAQADFYVCFRQADLPPISGYPPAVQRDVAQNRQTSTRQPCESCGETILVSADPPPNVPRICTHCHESVRRVASRMFGGKPS